MTPSFDAGQIEIDEVERVGQVDGEPVAALESPGGQGVGHAVTARVNIAEGVSRALPFESRLGGAQAERGIEPVAKIHGKARHASPLQRYQSLTSMLSVKQLSNARSNTSVVSFFGRASKLIRSMAWLMTSRGWQRR